MSTSKDELDFALDEDLALLLDTLVEFELDFGVTLEEDLASEEDGFTEELDSFAFSVEELDFSSFLEEEDEDPSTSLRVTLEEENEESSDGSGETEEEEESSPHATKIHAKIKTNTKRLKMDCFVVSLLAMTSFIKPPKPLSFISSII